MKQNRKTIGNQQTKRQLWERNNEIDRLLARLKKKKSSLLKLDMKQEIFLTIFQEQHIS